MLSGRGLCDGVITRPEETYRLWCVVVCDLETSRIFVPYIYDISSLRVNIMYFAALFISVKCNVKYTDQNFWVYLNCVYIDSLTTQGAKERRMQSSDTE